MEKIARIKERVLFLIEHDEQMYSFNKDKLSEKYCDIKLTHIADLKSILYLIEELECKS